MNKDIGISSNVSEEETFKFEKKQSAVEDIKQNSSGLRGTIVEQLEDVEVDNFSEVNKQLIKFHGLYQQKDRDRFDVEGKRVKKPYTFMLRGRITGGLLTAKQYCLWDSLADKYTANKSLRLTTRQCIQLHYLFKKDLRQVMQEIATINQSSMGACGDVVRNVTQAINPLADPKLSLLDEITQKLAENFLYQSSSYIEIWYDKKHVNKEEKEEFYGERYLPRKFKLGLTLEGNNTIDLYTNDLAFAATINGDKITGYHVFVGGGLGMLHRNENTFPRAASYVGWVSEKYLIPIAEAVVSIHRDHGNRLDRKLARLKYIIPEKGLDWVKKEIEVRAGTNLEEKEIPVWEIFNPIGWFECFDGTLCLGLHTLSGRVINTKDIQLKTALRKIVEQFDLSVQLTVDQNPLLLGIKKEDKQKVIDILNDCNVNPMAQHPIYNLALACPALPTCGLAITESERFLPNLLEGIKDILDAYNIDEKLVPIIRMTGCPNGCAKPYSAEIGIVGQQVGGKYALFLGGNRQGTVVGEMIAERIPINEIAEKLNILFSDWLSQETKEYFGDYVAKKGITTIKEIINES